VHDHADQSPRQTSAESSDRRSPSAAKDVDRRAARALAVALLIVYQNRFSSKEHNASLADYAATMMHAYPVDAHAYQN
jgi:hypothetical protein